MKNRNRNYVANTKRENAKDDHLTFMHREYFVVPLYLLNVFYNNKWLKLKFDIKSLIALSKDKGQSITAPNLIDSRVKVEQEKKGKKKNNHQPNERQPFWVFFAFDFMVEYSTCCCHMCTFVRRISFGAMYYVHVVLKFRLRMHIQY